MSGLNNVEISFIIFLLKLANLRKDFIPLVVASLWHSFMAWT
jgi:hypothetical protein